MNKVAIVGGGISGLSVLHFLKKRCLNGIEITLFERNSRIGGNIATFQSKDFLFETGPNGFLSSPETLELIEELDLIPHLISAQEHAKRRYVQIKNQLVEVPTSPIKFLKSPILSAGEKLKLFAGLFKKSISQDQSIYGYVSKRFGVTAAERIVDPFITGIYAGDIKRLHMASAFPKFIGNKSKPKKQMHSLARGMGQLIEALQARHRANIKTDNEVLDLSALKADRIILAAPSYVTSRLVQNLNPALSKALEQIPYAPLAVAAFAFDASAFKNSPDGFGYLVPSLEGKEILGVLIESNVFAGRVHEGQVLIRVMLGGSHHPAIINDSNDQIAAKALRELDQTFGITQAPLETFVKLWPKAIPQYELDYPQIRQAIKYELEKTPQITLCGNYLDGISVNDCIKNAKSIAAGIRI